MYSVSAYVFIFASMRGKNENDFSYSFLFSYFPTSFFHMRFPYTSSSLTLIALYRVLHTYNINIIKEQIYFNSSVN